MGLGWLTTMIQQGFIGLSSIQTVLQQEVPRRQLKSLPQAGLKSLFAENKLTVDNLSYRYPFSNKDTLKNVSFNIKPGQVIGLLGRIGSGKSTLVNGLNRYLDMGKGAIFVGKQDLAELSDNDIRSCIRTVSQEPFLFSDTVVKNIRFSDLIN